MTETAAMGALADEPPDPLLGRNVGKKFVLEKLLGAGAMGAVYRARQTALEKVVAIKVMHGELARDPMFAGRFHREAKAASRLDHPNSIRIIDYGQDDDGLLYIAMEYLDGRDLAHLLTHEWPLPTPRTIDLLGQALGAIAVAHDLGITHRDLKPENIMVLRRRTDEGVDVDVVKVCDFGIAKLVEAADDGPVSVGQKTGKGNLTTAGLVIGTPAYMSPEQGRGDPIDARSDLYSVGVILYQMLTGILPFDAPSAIGIVLKHQSEEPKPPSSINPAVDPRIETVCMRAMQKRPGDRYQTARELRTALREASDVAWTGPATMLHDAMQQPSAYGTQPWAGAGTAGGISGVRTAPLLGGSSPQMAVAAGAPQTTLPVVGTPGVAQAQIGVAKTELHMAAVPTSSVATMPARPPEPPASKKPWLFVTAGVAVIAGLGVWQFGMRGPRGRHIAAYTPPASAEVTALIVPDHVPLATTAETRLSSPEGTVTPNHEISPPTVHPVLAKKIVPVAAPVAPSAPPRPAPTPTPDPPPAVAAAPPPPVPSSAPVVAPSPAVVAPTYDLTRATINVMAPTNLNATTSSKVAAPLGHLRDQLVRCYRDALPAISVAGNAVSGVDTLHIEMDSLRVNQVKLSGPVTGSGLGKCIDGVVNGMSVQDADTGSSADIPLEFKPL